MHELRRKYETQEPWTDSEIVDASKGVAAVVLIALEIRKEMTAFVKKGGRIRKDSRPMAKQYLDRLKGALEGIWLGVGYLRKLMPEYLDRFDLGALLREAAAGESEPELIEMMFFSFCPTEVTLTQELRPAALTKVLEDRIEHLYVKERVYKNLDLKGMERETKKTRRSLQRQLERGEGKPVYESGGCYNNGMKALRASVIQMFYTLQARDVRRIELNADDSALWHTTLDEMGEPPDGLVQQMKEMAEEEARVIHVFDKEGYLLYVAMPVWYASEDPQSLMQRAALKQSRGARVDWEYNWSAATPGDAKEFHATLNQQQRRRVTEFLQRYPNRSFTIEEIAEFAGVPVHAPAETERFRAASAAWFTKNPDDTEGIQDVVDETAHNYGLLTALWKMDLD